MLPFFQLIVVGLLSSTCAAAPQFTPSESIAIGTLIEAKIVPRQAAIDPKFDVNQTFTGIEPTVVQMGNITEAEIATLLLPKPGDFIADNGQINAPIASSKRNIEKDGEPRIQKKQATPTTPTLTLQDDNSYASPLGAAPSAGVPVVSHVQGPFASIQLAGDKNVGILGLTVVDTNNVKTTFGTMESAQSEPGAFTLGPLYTFKDNEKITKLVTNSDKSPTDPRSGSMSFETSTGGSYTFTSGVDTTDFQAVESTIGSGFMGRIRLFKGPNITNQAPGLIQFDFLDTFTSIKILGYVYDGFKDTDNIPATNGKRQVLDSQAINNTGSSPISNTFTTTTTVARQHTWSLAEHFNVNEAISVATEVDVPLIAKTTESETTTFELGIENTNGKTVTTSVMQSQAFTLTCAPLLLCVGTASYMQYKSDFAFSALMQTTTAAGGTYQWYQRGTLSGADVGIALFTVQNFPITLNP